MTKISVFALAVGLVACPKQAPPSDSTEAGATVATSSGSATAAPTPSTASGAVTQAAATVSAAPDGPPAWLKLAAGESIDHPITSGSTKGCYALKSKKDPTGTIRCPPLATPLASVDDLDVDPAHECPPGFAVSGARPCSRTCRRDSDCHGHDVCDPDAHQCMRGAAPSRKAVTVHTVHGKCPSGYQLSVSVADVCDLACRHDDDCGDPAYRCKAVGPVELGMQCVR